jgi:polysaccharide export outer membrane protein
MKQLNYLKKACAWAFGLSLSVLLFTGCETPSSNSVMPANSAIPQSPVGDLALNPGDMVVITYSGVPAPPEKYEGRIKEDGHISLAYIGDVTASGKTAAELEKDITTQYTKFYNNLTVNVNTENRWFFVDGEVKQPQRLIYSGKITVLGAIASSGGFTDFANRRKVQLIRGKDLSTITQDCIKAKKKPELDMIVYPGDKISVPRRLY